MEIKIINNYYLRGDTHQWILSRREVSKKTGDSYFKDVGYYNDIKALLRNLLERTVRNEKLTSLHDLIQHTKSVKKQLSLFLDTLSEFDKELEVKLK